MTSPHSIITHFSFFGLYKPAQLITIMLPLEGLIKKTCLKKNKGQKSSYKAKDKEQRLRLKDLRCRMSSQSGLFKRGMSLHQRQLKTTMAPKLIFTLGLNTRICTQELISVSLGWAAHKLTKKNSFLKLIVLRITCNFAQIWFAK